jgi:uncharacterized protein (TIGR00369 family)
MSASDMTHEKIQEIMDGSPFIRFLGLRALGTDVGRGCVEFEIALRPEFERLPGTGQWHGGALASLIDTAGDFALVLTVGAPVPTINLRIDYLRPATTPKLKTTARVRRQGRTVGVVDIDVLDLEGSLVAVGRGCYGMQAG